MSSKTDPITEHDLHAYVDGQLSPERHALVEIYLNNHPDEAKRVAEFKQLNQLLKSRHDRTLQEEVPERFTTISVAPKKRVISMPYFLAASVVWMMLGGVIGWSLHTGTQTTKFLTAHSGLAQYAASAHSVYIPEVRHPVEVGAENEEHLVKWLSKRLGTELKAPNLNKFSYALIGGRLLPDEGQAAAQFMYENQTGNRLTLYIANKPDGENTAFRFAEEGNIRTFYWISGPLGYALSGDITKTKLLDIATEIYQLIES